MRFTFLTVPSSLFLLQERLLTESQDIYLFGRAPAGSGSGTVAWCRPLGGRQEAAGAEAVSERGKKKGGERKWLR